MSAPTIKCKRCGRSLDLVDPLNNGYCGEECKDEEPAYTATEPPPVRLYALPERKRKIA